jgi:hypothetical protein
VERVEFGCKLRLRKPPRERDRPSVATRAVHADAPTPAPAHHLAPLRVDDRQLDHPGARLDAAAFGSTGTPRPSLRRPPRHRRGESTPACPEDRL